MSLRHSNARVLLKTLDGFSDREIAAALVTALAIVTQRQTIPDAAEKFTKHSTKQ